MNFKRLIALSLSILPVFLMAQLPNASFTFNSATLCQGDSTEFVNTSTNYTNLHWFFDDGSDTWSRETPKHKYLNSGVFKVKLVAISALGKDSVEQQIEISAKPLVQISVDPLSKVINLGENATLSVSNGFSEYLWSTGDNFASINVYKEGNYWVKVTDNNNCSNSDTVFIAVIQEEMSVSSNILTPNNDGYNDYLEINDINQYNFPIEIFIYNIRNEQIYQNSDYQNNWDGDNYPAGSYFYILKTKDRRDKAGTINILR